MSKNSASLVEALGLLVTELRAGQHPDAALRYAGAAVTPNPWPQATAAPIGEIRAGLVADAAESAHPVALQSLAAAWMLGETSGVALANTIERLADSLRSDQRTLADLHASLAATKTTTRLLAALPLVGLVFGIALGAHPERVLLGSAAGLAATTAGVAFAAIGLWWTRRIIRRAEALL